MVVSKRSSRNLIYAALTVIFLIYLPFNIVHFLVTTTKENDQTESTIDVKVSDLPDTQPESHLPSKSPKTNIGAEIINIETDDVGNVQLQLQLSVKDLLNYIDGGGLKSGEMTSNPIPMEVPLLIDNPKICEESKKMRYLVYVHTSPNNLAKRNMLRKTWLSRTLFAERIIERIFLMGRSKNAALQDSIRKESALYGDIIQGDFLDQYRNLTLKALMGLKWISTNCRKARFVIKADDDAFVHIFNLIHLIESYEHDKRQKLLACSLWKEGTMPILRDPSKCSKWCVKFNEFPGQRMFPQYCAGLTFILSNDVVPDMYKVSRSTPFFWIDDVYVTGLLPGKVPNMQYEALRGNFSLKPDEGIAQLKDLKNPMTLLFIHAKKIEEYLPMWKMLLKRLKFDDVKTLSTEMVEGNADLKKVLQGESRSKKTKD